MALRKPHKSSAHKRPNAKKIVKKVRASALPDTTASPRPKLKLTDVDLLALQLSSLRLVTPSRPDLRLSVNTTADGAPIYFACDQTHALSWVEAKDNAGRLQVIVGRSQCAGKQRGMPGVFEYSQTFCEAGKAYFRISTTLAWRQRAIGIGIASISGDKTVNSVAITLRPRNEGIHIAGEAHVGGIRKKSSAVLPTQSRIGYRKEIDNYVKALGTTNAFTAEISRTSYFAKFLDRWSKKMQRSAITQPAARGNRTKKMEALLQSHRNVSHSRGKSKIAAPRMKTSQSSGQTFIGPIDASNANEAKAAFAAEMGDLTKTATYAAGTDGFILSGPLGAAGAAYIANLAAGSATDAAKQYFNGFVDQLVAAQAQAAADTETYAQEANGYASQVETDLTNAQAAADNGDPTTAQQWATQAQQDADLAMQSANQAIADAQASGVGMSTAMATASNALASANAALQNSGTAQGAATTAQQQATTEQQQQQGGQTQAELDQQEADDEAATEDEADASDDETEEEDDQATLDDYNYDDQ